MNDRDKILETIQKIKPQVVAMAEHGRFRNTELHRVRVAYLNALIRLLDLENKILESKDLDYIIKEIEALKKNTKR